jgi:hypothetical protein
MSLNLLHLANNITNDEYAKMVLSSGDYFPGFYRFTMGDRNYEDGQLSIKGLTSRYFEQISLNKTYSRNEWTEFTHKRLGTQDLRNEAHSDYAIYEILDEKYKEWMLTPNEYDIAVIDIDCGVDKLKIDQTYFFMGSLIRLTKDKLLIGYDDLRKTSVQEIPVDTNEIINYTIQIYKENHKEFFLPADVVASLKFDSDDQGHITMTDESLSRAVISDSNNIVIASNRDVSKHIPIRWAKDILLTDIGV